ncbi:MAG: hypothetical protein RR549_02310 [Oscillospiraceae bacterium]
MKKSFFGNNITPACEYCCNGTKTADKKMVLCGKKGIVAPFYNCRKFNYDPLRRTPKRRRINTQIYNPEDFKL